MRKLHPVLIAFALAGTCVTAYAQVAVKAPAKADASKASKGPSGATVAPKPYSGPKHLEEGEKRGAPKEAKKAK